jgi:hypothetical protein
MYYPAVDVLELGSNLKEKSRTNIRCPLKSNVQLVGGAITILNNDGVRQWEG